MSSQLPFLSPLPDPKMTRGLVPSGPKSKGTIRTAVGLDSELRRHRAARGQGAGPGLGGEPSTNASAVRPGASLGGAVGEGPKCHEADRHETAVHAEVDDPHFTDHVGLALTQHLGGGADRAFATRGEKADRPDVASPLTDRRRRPRPILPPRRQGRHDAAFERAGRAAELLAHVHLDGDVLGVVGGKRPTQPE